MMTVYETGLKIRTIKQIRKSYTRPKRYKQNIEEEEDGEEQQYEADPLDNIMPLGEVNVIMPCIGLVEKSRRVLNEVKFMNLYKRVDKISLINDCGLKKLGLDISLNAHHMIKPWRYMMDRLDSFGDLNTAMISKSLRDYHQAYEDLMIKHYNKMKYYTVSKIKDIIEKGKSQMTALCQMIDRQYPNNLKVDFIAKMDVLDIVNFTFTEGFLKLMGHSFQSILRYVKESGLPNIWGEKELDKIDLCSMIKEKMMNADSPGIEYPVRDIQLKCVDGERKCKLKLVFMAEPEEDGMRLRICSILDIDCDGNALKDEPKKLNLKAYKESNETMEVESH